MEKNGGHVHDPIYGFGSIRCRTCGESLLSAETQIGTAESEKRAIMLVLSIAVEGKYQAMMWSEGFPVFRRTANGLREEVYATKTGKRRYKVMKRVMVISE